MTRWTLPSKETADLNSGLTSGSVPLYSGSCLREAILFPALSTIIPRKIVSKSNICYESNNYCLGHRYFVCIDISMQSSSSYVECVATTYGELFLCFQSLYCDFNTGYNLRSCHLYIPAVLCMEAPD